MGIRGEGLGCCGPGRQDSLAGVADVSGFGFRISDFGFWVQGFGTCLTAWRVPPTLPRMAPKKPAVIGLRIIVASKVDTARHVLE